MTGTNGNDGVDIITEMQTAYAEKMAIAMASVQRAFREDPATIKRIANLLEEGIHVQHLRGLRNDELIWVQQLAGLGFIHVLNSIRERGEEIVIT